MESDDEKGRVKVKLLGYGRNIINVVIIIASSRSLSFPDGSEILNRPLICDGSQMATDDKSNHMYDFDRICASCVMLCPIVMTLHQYWSRKYER
jgi:hypothetical protein